MNTAQASLAAPSSRAPAWRPTDRRFFPAASNVSGNVAPISPAGMPSSATRTRKTAALNAVKPSPVRTAQVRST